MLIIAWLEDYRPKEAMVALEPPLLIGWGNSLIELKPAVWMFELRSGLPACVY